MARYTDAKCRMCRREGLKLYLKGDRCYTDKCSIGRRNYAPGQHGQNNKKLTNYGIQLREKQKVRRYYGVLESHFLGYFKKADKMSGKTGDNLLKLLELRFDNVIYRLGFASSRPEARQLVLHGHFTVNGKNADIPSMILKAGDEIKVREKSQNSVKFKDLVEAHKKTAPQWLQVDPDNFTGRIIADPAKEDIEIPIEEHLIVELYSR